MKSPHIAVIGTGISGLAAAYFLSRHGKVTLFEKENRIGGHSHTVFVDEEKTKSIKDKLILSLANLRFIHLVQIISNKYPLI